MRAKEGLLLACPQPSLSKAGFVSAEQTHFLRSLLPTGPGGRRNRPGTLRIFDGLAPPS